MMGGLVPRRVFLTRGKGVHRERLVSFELALRAAGIAPFNLVTVSSILPPGCEIVAAEEALPGLEAGQIVFCVLSRNDTNEPGEPIAGAVGLAQSQDPACHGYVAELCSSHQAEEEARRHAEDLAVIMLATARGYPLDEEGDVAAQLARMRAEVRDTTGIAVSASGDPSGRWTTVVAAAVFTD